MITIGIDLAVEDVDRLLYVARRLQDGERDDFFKDVASRLRPIRDLRPSDVNAAIGASWERFRTLRDDAA